MNKLLFLFFCFLISVGYPTYIPKSPFGNFPYESYTDSLRFSIFPNPVKDKILYIESSSNALKHIEIYNVLGEKKLELDTYDNKVFLEKLDTGIYIFLLKQEDQKGLRQLVVPRGLNLINFTSS